MPSAAGAAGSTGVRNRRLCGAGAAGPERPQPTASTMLWLAHRSRVRLRHEVGERQADTKKPYASTAVARDRKFAEPRAPNTVPDAPLPKAAPDVGALAVLQQHEPDRRPTADQHLHHHQNRMHTSQPVLDPAPGAAAQIARNSSRLERGAADQAAVDVGASRTAPRALSRLDAAAVQDPRDAAAILASLFRQPRREGTHARPAPAPASRSGRCRSPTPARRRSPHWRTPSMPLSSSTASSCAREHRLGLRRPPAPPASRRRTGSA